MFKRLINLWRGTGPQSLAMLAAGKRKPSTERLYVLSVDFAMKESVRDEFNKSLEPLREKFGLDFLVLEPGIKLKRFDDF